MSRTTRRRHSPGSIRRAVVTSTVEGTAAEWVSACAGGGALTAWALHLHASPPLVAAIGALPALAQAVHLPAARLGARVGLRTTTLRATLAARQPYLLLGLLPWLPLPSGARLAVLALVAASAAALGAVAQHAWTGWMTALFRPPVRGRILARRSARVALAGAAASLAVGTLLDRVPADARGAALGALALAGWAAGLVSWRLLAGLPAPRAARAARAAPVHLALALASEPVRRGLRYVVAWNAAMGITASVSALFMIQHLRLGFGTMAAHGLVVAAAATLAAPLWGRLVDRAGVAKVLVVSAVGAAALPLLWLAATEQVRWPIAIEAVAGGVLLGGQGVASAGLPVELAPRGRRAEVVASYSAAAGIAFATASLASGWLAAKLPFAFFVGGRGWVARKAVFAAGGAARLAAAALAARVFRREPRRAEDHRAATAGGTG